MAMSHSREERSLNSKFLRASVYLERALKNFAVNFDLFCKFLCSKAHAASLAKQQAWERSVATPWQEVGPEWSRV